MLYVVFPQALRRFLPPWINTVVATVQGSALVSLVGIVDLMLSIQQVIGRTFKPMPMYVLGALIYFVINYALSLTEPDPRSAVCLCPRVNRIRRTRW